MAAKRANELAVWFASECGSMNRQTLLMRAFVFLECGRVFKGFIALFAIERFGGGRDVGGHSIRDWWG